MNSFSQFKNKSSTQKNLYEIKLKNHQRSDFIRNILVLIDCQHDLQGFALVFTLKYFVIHTEWKFEKKISSVIISNWKKLKLNKDNWFCKFSNEILSGEEQFS